MIIMEFFGGNLVLKFFIVLQCSRLIGLYMYSPWGHKELDAIEQLSLSLPHYTNYIPEVYCWTALLQQHFVKDNRLFLLPLNPVLGW